MVVTVSPKYQVVIPKEVRETLAIKAGMQLSVVAKGGIAYLVPVTPPSRLRGLVGPLADKPSLRDKKDRPL